MQSQVDISVFNALKESTGEEFIVELIDVFLEDAPKLIAQMNSAIISQDTETFRRAAHSMKSNAATFGAMQLSELAKELETMARENNLDIGTKLQSLEDQYRNVESALKALR